MSFERFAAGPWVLPLLPWLATPIVLLYALRRRGFLRTWGLVFAALIAVDATFAGPFSPLRQDGLAASLVGVAFVIVGDFRYFLIVEGSRPRRRSFGVVVGIAIGLAFVVPLVLQAVRLSPVAPTDLRKVYLIYEVCFVLLLLLYGLVLGRASNAFERGLLRFELTQYLAWASVDVLMLVTHKDVLHAVRIMPNILYYVAFVPYALHAQKTADET